MAFNIFGSFIRSDYFDSFLYFKYSFCLLIDILNLNVLFHKQWVCLSIDAEGGGCMTSDLCNAFCPAWVAGQEELRFFFPILKCKIKEYIICHNTSYL